MGKWITCLSVSVYEQALTRGSKYELLEMDKIKAQVRLRGDNGRTRWFSTDCFDLDGGEAPTLVRWWFAEKVEDENCDCVDVSFELSDGTCRWCWVCTPDYLKQLLESRSDPKKWGSEFEPAFWDPHTIIMLRIADNEVDWMLRELDRQGQLLTASMLFEPPTLEENDLMNGEND